MNDHRELDPGARVVIIGGGFAGLNVARGLRRADVQVTLIDRTNHHLFQPLLYQVATGGLSPADIASPIRHILRRQHNVTVLMDEVTGIDSADRLVITDGALIPYDVLVVAAGATHHYFGNEAWEQHAPGLKTLADATNIRGRVLAAFERAEREPGACLTFVVVGAGPTGVEVAGTIAEMARHTLRKDFTRIDPASARVLLVEYGPRVLAGYPEDLSRKAAAQLRSLGVELRTGWRVTDIGADHVDVTDDTTTEAVETAAVVWAAGVTASPLGRALADCGVELDGSGRVVVTQGLTIPGRPDVFVIGDLAHVEQEGEIVAGVAPAAIQMGRYTAAAVRSRLRGGQMPPFAYKDKGSLATIGRSAAVADFGRIRFGGWTAWIAWLAIHIYFLIGFENRVLVILQWAWNYVTRNRSARLIVAHRPQPDGREAPE
ncbi:MAG: NAD(P)/FAD-dependent oxidoreductase [Acidimicrobiia bacterium]|nr:NAD(P)/FAD-dependent oxidoreductase [Acidimicrobiia bacterium]